MARFPKSLNRITLNRVIMALIYFDDSRVKTAEYFNITIYDLARLFEKFKRRSEYIDDLLNPEIKYETLQEIAIIWHPLGLTYHVIKQIDIKERDYVC